MCPGSTGHQYFQEWFELGIFDELWELALAEYDRLEGLDWEWQSVDGAMTKAPLGGEKTGPNPTDRALGEAGRRLVQREFSVDQMLQRTAAVYRDVLAEAGRVKVSTVAELARVWPPPVPRQKRAFSWGGLGNGCNG